MRNNNIMNNSPSQQHFSLRKLTVGLASVLLSTTFYLTTSNSQTVKADTVTPSSEQVENTDVTNDSNAQTSQSESTTNPIQVPIETSQDTESTTDVKPVGTSQDSESTTKPIPVETTQNKEPVANHNSQNVTVQADTDGDTEDWYEYDTVSDTLNITGKKTFNNPHSLFNLGNKYAGTVKHVNILDDITITGDASLLFQGLPNLISITGLDKVNTSDVTVMQEMFANSPNLVELDLSHFDTRKVNNMYGMFSGCSALKKVNLSGFNTAEVTLFESMFEGCNHLENVDISSFTFDQASDVNRMFADCSSLQSIDFSNRTAPRLTFMEEMFQNCASLKTANFSNFVAPKMMSAIDMFQNCADLETINLDGFSLSEQVLLAYDLDMSEMFQNCRSLKKLDFSKAKIYYPGSLDSMCQNCTSLTNVDLSGILTFIDEDNTKPNDVGIDVYALFENVPNLKVLTLGSKNALPYYEQGENMLLSPDGYWLNKGTGSIRQPQGNKAWTSEELMANYDPRTDADTWVRVTDFVFYFTDQDNGNKNIDNISPIIVEKTFNEPVPKFTVAQTDEMKATIKKLEEMGYTLVKNPFDDKDSMDLTLDKVDFNFEFKHLTDDKLEERENNFIIHFVDDKGQTVAPDYVQKVKSHRTVQVSRVNGKVMDDSIPWIADKEYYDDVKLPNISGFTPDNKTASGTKIVSNTISKIKVDPTKDVIDSVTYTPVSDSGSVTTTPSDPEDIVPSEPDKPDDDVPNPNTQSISKPTSSKKPHKVTNIKQQPKVDAPNAIPAASINTSNVVNHASDMLPQTGTEKSSNYNLALVMAAFAMLGLGSVLKPKKAKRED